MIFRVLLSVRCRRPNPFLPLAHHAMGSNIERPASPDVLAATARTFATSSQRVHLPAFASCLYLICACVLPVLHDRRLFHLLHRVQSIGHACPRPLAPITIGRTRNPPQRHTMIACTIFAVLGEIAAPTGSWSDVVVVT